MIKYPNLTRYRTERVYRVIVSFVGGYSTGSGFFIRKNLFLTCFHVAFTKELRRLRLDPLFKSIHNNNEHLNLLEFYKKNILKVEIEVSDNLRVIATLKNFDEKHDIAIFEVPPNGQKIKICALDFKPKLDRGDYVFFGGFPMHHDYAPDKTPFAVHEGMISSFVETIIGGDKYTHLQINSINLGGNSGAPLFKKYGWRVVGIVNGNMNWGYDYVMIGNPQNTTSTPQSFRVPLSIAYATPINILMENTKIFTNS